MFPKVLNKKSSSKLTMQSILILIGSMLLYVIHDTLIKLLSPEIELNQIIFFRSLFSLIPILVMANFEKKRYSSYLLIFKTNFLRAHFVRCVVFGLSLLFYILACRLLPLPEVYSLSYSSPLFVTIFSAFLLKEKLSLRRLFFVLTGLVGVIIVLRPGSTCFQWQAIAPILSGLFTALSIIWGRQLSFADSNSLICLIYSIFCIVLSGLTLPFTPGEISAGDLNLLIYIGFLAAIAQWGFLQAFRMTSALVLAPYDYLGLLWATLISYFIFYQLPDLYTVIGASVIIITGLANIYFEKK